MKLIKRYITEAKKPKNFTILVIYLLLFISVLAESLLFSFIVTLLLLLALIIYKNSILGFYLGVFSLSFDQIFVPTVFSLKIHMLVFLATSLALAYLYLKEKKLPQLPPKSLFIPLLLLFFFSVASTLVAVDKVRTVRFLGALVYAYAVFTITYIFVSDKWRAIKTVIALSLGLAISTMVAIYEFLAFYFNIKFGYYLWTKFNIFNPGNFARPKGLYDHTNNLANFLLIAIPLLLAQILWEKRTHFLKLILVISSITVLLITLSRAAVVGFLVTVLILSFFGIVQRRSFLFRKKVLLIPVLVLLFVWFLMAVVGPLRQDFEPTYKVRKTTTEGTQQELLVSRIESTIDPKAVTTIERIQIWNAGLRMAQDYWLTGIGLENFSIRYSEYKQAEAKREEVSAHNTYLQLLIESGIFGFLAFAWFASTLVLVSLRGIIKSKDPVIRPLLIGGLAVLVGVTIQNLTNSVFYFAHTWFLYGFLAALARLNLSKK